MAGISIDGNEKNTGDNGINDNRTMIVCEKCGRVYKFRVISYKIEEKENKTGITNVLLEPPCKHKILLYIDVNGKVRGKVTIDRYVTEIESIEMQGYDDKIIELQKKHDRLIKDKDYNKAFSIKKKIASLEKEKEEFKNIARKKGLKL